jgi:hypothetical protein
VIGPPPPAIGRRPADSRNSMDIESLSTKARAATLKACESSFKLDNSCPTGRMRLWSPKRISRAELPGVHFDSVLLAS